MNLSNHHTSDMRKVNRLLPLGCIVIALLLWIAHLFLPTLQQEPPLPGWMQIYLMYWPIYGVLVMSSHLLFLSAVVACAFRRWLAVTLLVLSAAGVLAAFGPGPIWYSGIQALWAAYISVFLAGAVGLVMARINSASFRPVISFKDK